MILVSSQIMLNVTDLFLDVLGHPVDGVLGVLVRPVDQRPAVRVERLPRCLPATLVAENFIRF